MTDGDHFGLFGKTTNKRGANHFWIAMDGVDRF